MFAEIKTAGSVDKPNVAMSFAPFGTVGGVQFVAVFQLPELAFRSHVALPPRAILVSKINTLQAMIRHERIAKEEQYHENAVMAECAFARARETAEANA